MMFTNSSYINMKPEIHFSNELYLKSYSPEGLRGESQIKNVPKSGKSPQFS